VGQYDFGRVQGEKPKVGSPSVEFKAHADLVNLSIDFSLKNKPNEEVLDLRYFDVKLLNNHKYNMLRRVEAITLARNESSSLVYGLMRSIK